MTQPSEPDITATPHSDPEERDDLLARAGGHKQRTGRTDEPGSRTLHVRFQRLDEGRAGRADVVEGHPRGVQQD